jgi:hypothetical protein
VPQFSFWYYVFQLPLTGQGLLTSHFCTEQSLAITNSDRAEADYQPPLTDQGLTISHLWHGRAWLPATTDR